LLAEQGDRAQALSEYRQAREIIARLAAQSPDDATLPDDLAVFDEEIAKLEQSDAAPPKPAQPAQQDQPAQ
jgi:hypothetical protein